MGFLRVSITWSPQATESEEIIQFSIHRRCEKAPSQHELQTAAEEAILKLATPNEQRTSKAPLSQQITDGVANGEDQATESVDDDASSTANPDQHGTNEKQLQELPALRKTPVVDHFQNSLCQKLNSLRKRLNPVDVALVDRTTDLFRRGLKRKSETKSSATQPNPHNIEEQLSNYRQNSDDGRQLEWILRAEEKRLMRELKRLKAGQIRFIEERQWLHWLSSRLSRYMHRNEIKWTGVAKRPRKAESEKGLERAMGTGVAKQAGMAKSEKGLDRAMRSTHFAFCIVDRLFEYWGAPAFAFLWALEGKSTYCRINSSALISRSVTKPFAVCRRH